uniref:DUF1816 domain-containing protein n=1 Tax=Cyanothece sp. (strain PCC 7425 / ATCC 29141) TaxID=395961 RepID=B8HJN0_CYAP4
MTAGKGETSGISSWLANLANQFGQAWWVEIVTGYPRCTYYFGPFLSKTEAEAAKPGYIEDLEREEAANISATVKRCKPSVLTIFEEAEPQQVPSFSGLTR